MEQPRTTANIRRFVLDVDKAIHAPSLVEVVTAIQNCAGVEAVNITVSEIDIETVGTNVTIEGAGLDYEDIVRAIEKTGAVVHGLDQIVAGDRILENVPRSR
jgi:hypothetical protein